eukprot:365200-Chlamydomonas_euryale.AAC.3
MPRPAFVAPHAAGMPILRGCPPCWDELLACLGRNVYPATLCPNPCPIKTSPAFPSVIHQPGLYSIMNGPANCTFRHPTLSAPPPYPHAHTLATSVLRKKMPGTSTPFRKALTSGMPEPAADGPTNTVIETAASTRSALKSVTEGWPRGVWVGGKGKPRCENGRNEGGTLKKRAGVAKKSVPVGNTGWQQTQSRSGTKDGIGGKEVKVLLGIVQCETR